MGSVCYLFSGPGTTFGPSTASNPLQVELEDLKFLCNAIEICKRDTKKLVDFHSDTGVYKPHKDTTTTKVRQMI